MSKLVNKGDKVSVKVDGETITGTYSDYEDKAWIIVSEPHGYVEGTVILIPWHTIRHISWGFSS